jgi:hypothetical protein
MIDSRSLLQPAEFAWRRPASGRGFAWNAPNPGPGAVLVPVEGTEWIEYFPMKDERTLFLIFSHTVPTAEAILDFANRFGDIGCSLVGWQLAIGHLKRLLNLWDAAKREDAKLLRELLRETNPRRPGMPLIGTKYEGWPKVLKAGSVEDLVSIAFETIAIHALAGMGETYYPTIAWHRETGWAETKFVPSDLVTAMKIQLYLAAGRNKKFVECAGECGTYIELSPDITRAHTVTCSPACRQRAYRLRQQQARDLRAKGWSLKRISAELGSDVATIKKWLPSSKE